MHFRTLLRAGPTALAASLAACVPDTTQPLPLEPDVTIQIAADSTHETLDIVARGLAHALQAPGLRKQLLEDLRDSPFPAHRLHLKSYLNGARGRAIAVAASRATNLSPQELARRVQALPEMDLWLPVSADRLFWRGGDSIAVAATLASREQYPDVGEITGYRPGGKRTMIALGSANPFAVLLLGPADTEYPADPEAARLAAPGQTRSSVSTTREEWALIGMEDDTAGCTPGVVCASEGVTTSMTTSGWGYSLSDATTYLACTSNLSGNDRDHDGLRDDCEYTLASTFRPYLQVSSRDGTLARQSYWAVKRTDKEGRIRVFYALGYHRDGGTNRVGFLPHLGDSEFIILTLDYMGANRWMLYSAVLSAHYGSPFEATRSWGYSQMEYPETFRGRPRVWVAEEKHANWTTKVRCNEGAVALDTCNNNGTMEHTMVSWGRNLGGSYNFGNNQLIDCTTHYGYSREECFWSRHDFAGWHSPAWYELTSISYRASLLSFEF